MECRFTRRNASTSTRPRSKKICAHGTENSAFAASADCTTVRSWFSLSLIVARRCVRFRFERRLPGKDANGSKKTERLSRHDELAGNDGRGIGGLAPGAGGPAAGIVCAIDQKKTRSTRPR